MTGFPISTLKLESKHLSLYSDRAVLMLIDRIVLIFIGKIGRMAINRVEFNLSSHMRIRLKIRNRIASKLICRCERMVVERIKLIALNQIIKISSEQFRIRKLSSTGMLLIWNIEKRILNSFRHLIVNIFGKFLLIAVVGLIPLT